MSCYYFVGCPLFSVTLHATAQGHTPTTPNPTDRLLFSETKQAGDRFLWIGQRLVLIYEPRSLRPSSPLLVIE